MKALTLNQTKQWLKTSQHPMAKMIFSQLKKLFRFELPAPKFILRPMYFIYQFSTQLFLTFTRVIIWTPLLKGRLHRFGENLNLYGGLPYISGPLQISLGDNCRISGQSTLTGRSCAPQTPQLILGDNIDIGWMTTIAVATRVQLGNNVRIAGRALLAGYPGHPIDAEARAIGLPETDDQVGDIVLEDDVWLATGVSVMAGVTIGQGTIVAAGSVVTHDLPAMVLAAGIPAKVIRSLAHNNSAQEL
ncbi:acetyltransferase [Psychromonas sp. psych-6C06]|uniref:acyltransferase n=1 Tax=Psychromonas sp. psych-6C06 TaxID=2058089 RepID=UPI000C31EBCC|nr:acyltransferase [Psychromonas sp. psych-6C06]PKF62485.1 acetyltransferase [Psychromonas sp. psych-6C06]